MSKITDSQMKRIHGLLNKAGLMARKPDLVHGFGNCTSIKEMAMSDAKKLIAHLEGMVQHSAPEVTSVRCEIMRKKILSYCYRMEWTRYDETKQRAVVDFERLDAFLLKAGVHRRKLMALDYSQLVSTVTQFENMDANNGMSALGAQARSLVHKKGYHEK